MKKIFVPVVLLLFILSSSFGYYFFSWAGISATQGVSEANLYNACINSPWFQIKGAFPNSHSSNHILTKAQVDACVFIDAANATLSAKASNQIVVKQDLTNPTFGSFIPHSISTAYGSSTAACGVPFSNNTVFTNPADVTPTISSVIYSNSTLTIVFNGGNIEPTPTPGSWYQVQYGATTYLIKINSSGVIQNFMTSSCSPT